MRVTGVPLRGCRGHLPRPTALLFLHTGGQASGLLLQRASGQEESCVVALRHSTETGTGEPRVLVRAAEGLESGHFPSKLLHHGDHRL